MWWLALAAPAGSLGGRFLAGRMRPSFGTIDPQPGEIPIIRTPTSETTGPAPGTTTGEGSPSVAGAGAGEGQTTGEGLPPTSSTTSTDDNPAPLLPQQGTRQKPTFDWTLTPNDRSGLGHVDYRHAPWSTEPKTSKFTQDAWNNLKALVDEAAENGTLGTVKPDEQTGAPQAGVVYEYRFDTQIGASSRGKPLFRLRVIVDANNHVTSTFPF